MGSQKSLFNQPFDLFFGQKLCIARGFQIILHYIRKEYDLDP